ncbi:TPA: 4Fe-4S binding protein [Escherichia coli]|nr:4Fe-4S binding protein [Escherichia coli]HCO8659166.1 4Fe-4S binding protein [Escherichia coli]
MNRFIMANSQQCLGCHACEIACVMAHNDEQHVLSQHHFHPRITVIKHQQQRSAVTCHHCEDAPCARSCPNGAISHVDDSIQVNQQKCIGCKSCVVACPFGTMQIVLTPHSLAWRNPAACAPHVRSINRGMPVPRHKKCR